MISIKTAAECHGFCFWVWFLKPGIVLPTLLYSCRICGLIANLISPITERSVFYLNHILILRKPYIFNISAGFCCKKNTKHSQTFLTFYSWNIGDLLSFIGIYISIYVFPKLYVIFPEYNTTPLEMVFKGTYPGTPTVAWMFQTRIN